MKSEFVFGELSHSTGSTYPGRALEEGMEKASPLRNPTEARQILSQCRCGYWTPPRVAGKAPQHAFLLAAPSGLCIAVKQQVHSCHEFWATHLRNYISLRTDGLASNFISAQVCVFTQDQSFTHLQGPSFISCPVLK